MSDTAVEEVPRAPEDTSQHEEHKIEAVSPFPSELGPGIELEEVGGETRPEKRY